MSLLSENCKALSFFYRYTLRAKVSITSWVCKLLSWS